MNIDNLNYDQIRNMEAEVRARREEITPSFQHYGSVENLSDNQIRGMEAEIKARREEITPSFQHYGSVENLSDNQIRSMEAEIKARREEITPTFQHHGSVENLSDNQIRGMEAEIKARREEITPSFQHYGSVENLSDNQIRSMEAEIKARREEVRPTYQHYGSVENMSDSDIRTMEAQVTEKRQQDIPFRQYLRDLVTNPRIFDENAFESATIRSMQSNGIIKEFVGNLIDKVNEKIFQLKSLTENDKENILTLKSELESLLVIYEKYLYNLKQNNWNFADLPEMMLPEDVMEDLWQIQKDFDFTLNMPIPADLGDYYGHEFERTGRMIPGLRFMYDDLMGKEVNWHQVLIYKENELTPHQRYLQRREEKRKVFENARQQEINSVLSQVREMTEESLGGRSI